MARITAIIPAYNEAATVGPIVRLLKRSRAFGEVIVVSDGSVDDTASEAARAGARVIVHARNQGKGRAMRAGARAARTSIIAFFDADLLGLRVWHVRALIDPVVRGVVAMNVGVIDRGALVSALVCQLPLLSGQRVLYRSMFLQIPVSQLEGYRVEAAVNRHASLRGFRVGVVRLRGLSMRRKHQKVGARKALVAYMRMWREVGDALWPRWQRHA